MLAYKKQVVLLTKKLLSAPIYVPEAEAAGTMRIAAIAPLLLCFVVGKDILHDPCSEIVDLFDKLFNASYTCCILCSVLGAWSMSKTYVSEITLRKGEGK